MEGFFQKKETASEKFSNGKALTCVSCGRYANAVNPKMEPVGNFNKRILNIFSAPGESEDKKGNPFTGQLYRYVQSIYSQLGVDLFEDCLNTYACWCTGGEPTPTQIDNHRRILNPLIQEKKPLVIVAFGESALVSLIGNRWKKDFGDMDKWRGWNIPDQYYKSWVCPVYSPEKVKDSPSEVMEVIFVQDLKKALSISQPAPVQKEPTIHYISDLSPLSLIKSHRIAFDYETTGIKPHAEGHQIVCASVAVNDDEVYSFMLPETKRQRKPFTDLLQNPKISKIAQNMKFEDHWTNSRLKIQVTHWGYDTMIAQHIMDNRQGVKGLKFQTYVYLGIIDYDSEISDWLKSPGKNDNEHNKVLELCKSEIGKKELLKYCALDSIYEIRICSLFSKKILGTVGLTDVSPEISDFPSAYSLFHKGTLALAKAERVGLRIDVDYIEKTQLELEKRIKDMEVEIYASKFYRHWKRHNPNPNLNSGAQLGTFLYDVKGIQPPKFTTSGKGSTDEETLRLLNIPELDMILERSKLLTLKDTFLHSLMKEQVNGKVHPFFNLHLVRTYRSSSNSPNFQNVPKKDEDSMRIIRQALYPRKGNQLLEMDYSGIEVAIAACYHKDPTMLSYITDPSKDMHGDMAAQIFKITNFDRKKKEHAYMRSCIKNSFVFPQFYGDYYVNCASNICKWMKLSQTKFKWNKDEGVEISPGVSIASHFINNGIETYSQLVEYIKQIESHFWNVRFKGYAKWKKSFYSNYLEKGYISLKTGFVCKGVMSKNDVLNYPVQGTAFHCLLWTFAELTERMEQKGMKSKLVGQIHDAIVLDVFPDELMEVVTLANEIGTKELIKRFPWIIVPMRMEAELCPVDGSWADKKQFTFQ